MLHLDPRVVSVTREIGSPGPCLEQPKRPRRNRWACPSSMPPLCAWRRRMGLCVCARPPPARLRSVANSTRRSNDKLTSASDQGLSIELGDMAPCSMRNAMYLAFAYLSVPVSKASCSAIGSAMAAQCSSAVSLKCEVRSGLKSVDVRMPVPEIKMSRPQETHAATTQDTDAAGSSGVPGFRLWPCRGPEVWKSSEVIGPGHSFHQVI